MVNPELQNKPPFLYKVLPYEQWMQSQDAITLFLPSSDDDFIHLATQEQLERIIAKFFADVPEYVVLKVDVTKLTGRLAIETNPGGTTMFYHLYDGSIPREAVVECVAQTSR